jgi:hypothetical protein
MVDIQAVAKAANKEKTSLVTEFGDTIISQMRCELTIRFVLVSSKTLDVIYVTK